MLITRAKRRMKSEALGEDEDRYHILEVADGREGGKKGQVRGGRR